MAKKKKKESPEEKLANVAAAQLAAQVANWAAQLEFQKERMRLLEMPEMQGRQSIEIDRLAFDKAESTWKRALEESSVTGTYNGQPTQEWLERQARLTGVLNGQQTLEGRLTDAQVAQMNHAMAMDGRRITLEETQFQFEKERFGTEFAHQQEQDRIGNRFRESELTGRLDGRNTLARDELEANERQQYLSLLSSLQGSPFKTMRMLGNTPQGLTDLVNAWAGKYQMGGLTGSGQAPGAPQLSDLWNPMGVPVGTSGPVGTPGSFMNARGVGGPAGEVGYTMSPFGTQAPLDAYNYQATPSGQTQVYPPGVQAPPNDAQVSTQTPLSPGQAQQAAASMTPGMLTPNQINAENYANTNKVGQDLMWQYFEDAQGWAPGAAQDSFLKSLPRYGGPKQGTVSAGLGF
jgi:hypothetical protein